MNNRLKICLDFSGILADDYEPTKYCLEKVFGKFSKYTYNGFVKNKLEYILYVLFNIFLRRYFLLKEDKIIRYINCMENQNIKIYSPLLEKILYLKEKYNVEYYVVSLQHERIIYKTLSNFSENFIDLSRIYGLEEILKRRKKDLTSSKINLLAEIGCNIYVTDDPNEKKKIEKNYKDIKVFLIKSNYFKHKNMKYNKIKDIEEYIAKFFQV